MKTNDHIIMESLYEKVQEKNLNESHNDSVEAVKRAISRRIMNKHLDLISQYGIEKVMDAIDEVSTHVAEGGNLQEIGSSDVSGWVNWVVKDLTRREDTVDRFQRMNDTWNKNASPEAKAGKEKLLGMMGKFGNSLGPEGARG